jgi:hypothetical protein
MATSAAIIANAPNASDAGEGAIEVEGTQTAKTGSMFILLMRTSRR